MAADPGRKYGLSRQGSRVLGQGVLHWGERERHADIAGSVRTVASTVAADSRPTDPLFFLLLTRVTFAPSCFTTAVFHTSANLPGCDIPTSLSWKQLYPWGNTPTYCCVTFLAIAVFHASALSQEPSLSFLHSLSVSFARLHFASCLIAEGCLFNVTCAITERKKAIYV